MKGNLLVSIALVLGIGAAASASAQPCPSPTFVGIQCDSLGTRGTPFVRGINCRVTLVDGYPRDYIVYVPRSQKYHLDKAAPLVMHFHGSGGSSQGTLNESGWREKAEDAGFVAVFGSGLVYQELPEFGGELKSHWNDAILATIVDLPASRLRLCYPPTAPWPSDDVKFVNAMLDDVEALLPIDSREVYGSGFSNGNAFLRRVITEIPERFSSAGGGGLAADALLSVPSPSRRVSYYNTVGGRDAHTVDQINAMDPFHPPITELPLTYNELFASAFIQAAIYSMLDTFGLSHLPDRVWEFKNELRVEYRTPVAGNTDGNEFIFAVQKGVYHQYPNGADNPEGFDNPDIFWKFFHKHPFPK